MSEQILGMIGLYGGAAFGILGWWFGRRMAKKQRGLDELHDHIWQKARSISWYFTLGSTYVLFSLILFGIEIKAGMLLGIIMLVHMASWGIIGVILSINMNMTEPLKPSRVKFGISIVAVSLIIFAILSITTGNWWFLIASIPPSTLGLISALTPDKSVTD
ncbi:hypothetical protein NC661_04800 [Aquibacillus koreensis]|uniref:DUF2178 domain-containing protein n=1 Tax=Aquibacillus koreensis TaxID=279446 RepID=A0A9X3WIP9_9BACI|nr:hypothetical protein [Aquibacillus koreensis]MCT2534707.1 hypothetical protein [Aquibacillus koreensis]MDC3419683.1 hypothetical protein [Aquibacillus koreensis]